MFELPKKFESFTEYRKQKVIEVESKVDYQYGYINMVTVHNRALEVCEQGLNKKIEHEVFKILIRDHQPTVHTTPSNYFDGTHTEEHKKYCIAYCSPEMLESSDIRDKFDNVIDVLELGVGKEYNSLVTSRMVKDFSTIKDEFFIVVDPRRLRLSKLEYEADIEAGKIRYWMKLLFSYSAESYLVIQKGE
jgi:hypothetical protein